MSNQWQHLCDEAREAFWSARPLPYLDEATGTLTYNGIHQISQQLVDGLPYEQVKDIFNAQAELPAAEGTDLTEGLVRNMVAQVIATELRIHDEDEPLHQENEKRYVSFLALAAAVQARCQKAAQLREGALNTSSSARSLSCALASIMPVEGHTQPDAQLKPQLGYAPQSHSMRQQPTTSVSTGLG